MNRTAMSVGPCWTRRRSHTLKCVMERLYGTHVATVFTAMVLWTAFGSVFALLLGYSRIPYAAALDGTFFRVFGRVHPHKHFPHVSLVVIGCIAILCSTFSLGMLLPSFLYLPGEADFPAGSLALPWEPAPSRIAGELARKRGAENPVRLVSSAKSWLSHGAANRSGAILPWGAPPEVPKVSPLDASASYLAHLRDAWTQQSGTRLEDEDVLLTVPASFDEEARVLTVRAAEEAGLAHVTLLEEPQAAFYAWIADQGERWRRRVRVGDLVLVCDVGGGTTDFSLIAVSEENGELRLERVAVGEHILLGGDNMMHRAVFVVHRASLITSGRYSS